MADVFLSYSRNDFAYAQRIAELLKQSGVSVWWDNRLTAGDHWDEVVRKELDGARAVVVLWTKTSWNSRWVQAEAMDGHSRGILIGARLDDVIVGVPFNLVQLADLREWNLEGDFGEIVELLQGVEGKIKKDIQPINEFCASAVSPAELQLLLSAYQNNELPDASEERLERYRFGRAANADAVPATELTNDELYLLALAYAKGNGVAESQKRAVQLLRIGADRGDKFAQAMLAVQYEYGFGVDEDLSTAAALYEKAAAQDLVPAMLGLAALLENGTGIDLNYSRAADLYRRAVELGNIEAHFSLGRMYQFGCGVVADIAEANRLLKVAAENGHSRAKLLYGMNLSRAGNNEEAAACYKSAAELGETDGLILLAKLHHRGVLESASPEHAAALLREAAEKGNRTADLDLAKAYMLGKGLPQDFAQAAHFFKLAAEHSDNPDAYYGLAVLSEDGKGVEQSDREALRFYQLAHEKGQFGATHRLGECYFVGHLVDRNFEAAAKYFRLAAEHGDARSQRYLGICYSEGAGVRKDLAEAMHWLGLAAERGDSKAQYELGKLTELGEGRKKDNKEALRLYKLAAGQGLEIAKDAVRRMSQGKWW